MDGVIIINKPKDFTSHDVVSIVRKTINQKSVGHIGTLDPNATGVLPILIGKATKISKYLIEHDKAYTAVLKLGEKKDTGDATGNTIKKDEVRRYTVEEIEMILNSFIGEIEQTPPLYSSIKINGKKLYEYARKGQTVVIPKRRIKIYDIKLLNIDNEMKEIMFEVKCSKGTYIRSLCEDIASKLGTIGYMKDLIRTCVDSFNINDSIKLENIDIKSIKNKIVSVEKIFESNERIDLNDKELKLFLNGVKLTKKADDNVYRIYNNNIFIGLGIVRNNLLKRDVIINI